MSLYTPSSCRRRSPEGPGRAAWPLVGLCWVLCPSAGPNKVIADTAISAAKDNDNNEGVERPFLIIVVLLSCQKIRSGSGWTNAGNLTAERSVPTVRQETSPIRNQHRCSISGSPSDRTGPPSSGLGQRASGQERFRPP